MMAGKKKQSTAKGKRVKSGRIARSRVSPSGSREFEGLFNRVRMILDEARGAVVRSVNSQMVLAYWRIGQAIVDTLQGGDARAEYGRQLIADLSGRLTERYGPGFSTTNLWYFRQFYQVFADRNPVILHTLRGESAPSEKLHKPGGESSSSRSGARRRVADQILTDLALAVEPGNRQCGFSGALSWSHYRTLTKVESRAERRFLEIEAEAEGWSVPQLERQIHSMLFMRLMKSRDKAGVLELARKGQEIQRPVDALKDPYVLDFLDLPDGGRLRESELEAAIISQLQSFLLELGKGFAFVARQKRLAYEDEHFYVDLVFYHTILRCHLLIDLKIGKLSHKDIGQMDSYVRLFDDRFALADDGPTIGLILCAEKNEAIARYSVLNENRQVFAAKYLKYLPTEAELQHEIERERRLIEARHVDEKKH